MERDRRSPNRDLFIIAPDGTGRYSNRHGWHNITAAQVQDRVKARERHLAFVTSYASPKTPEPRSERTLAWCERAGLWLRRFGTAFYRFVFQEGLSMTVKDWNAPLYVEGTNRPVVAERDADRNGERICFADWAGNGAVYGKRIQSNGAGVCQRFHVTNTPASPIWPKLDDDAVLRIARQARATIRLGQRLIVIY